MLVFIGIKFCGVYGSCPFEGRLPYWYNENRLCFEINGSFISIDDKFTEVVLQKNDFRFYYKIFSPPLSHNQQIPFLCNSIIIPQKMKLLYSIIVCCFAVCYTTFSQTISSNAPLCGNANLTLELTATGGTTYAWKGPNSFTSTQQKPNIKNVNWKNRGVYLKLEYF
jgi:hypothetical protein